MKNKIQLDNFEIHNFYYFLQHFVSTNEEKENPEARGETQMGEAQGLAIFLYRLPPGGCKKLKCCNLIVTNEVGKQFGGNFLLPLFRLIKKTRRGVSAVRLLDANGGKECCAAGKQARGGLQSWRTGATGCL